VVIAVAHFGPPFKHVFTPVSPQLRKLISPPVCGYRRAGGSRRHNRPETENETGRSGQGRQKE